MGTLAMCMMTLMGLSMGLLGLVFYLKHLGIENDFINFLPVIGLCIYCFCFGAGASPPLWVFVGELMPPEYKVLSGIVTFFASVCLLIVTTTFPLLLTHLAPHGTYWVYASIALLSNIFYYYFVPETKGKSLLEIQQNFAGKKKNRIEKKRSIMNLFSHLSNLFCLYSIEN